MSITTTSSVSGKMFAIPPCEVCKRKVEGVLYTKDSNGNSVCAPCFGKPIDEIIRIIPDAEDA